MVEIVDGELVHSHQSISSFPAHCKPRASASGTGSALTMHSATWRGTPLRHRAGQIDTSAQDGTAPNRGKGGK